MDVGLRVLARIHERLMIDEQWTVRRERGFSWIGNALVQHIDVTPAFESRDILVHQVVVQSRVVAETTTAEETIEQFLAINNCFAIGSALVYDRAEHTIDLMLAHTVHAETLEFRASHLADLAILQLWQAERDALALAEICGGSAAYSPHPISGWRPEPDEMLGVADAIYIPAGRESSRFARLDEMERIQEFVHDSTLASLGASSTGIAIEVPFGPDDTALIQLHTDVRHPLLGAGLAVRTMVRLDVSSVEAADIAARLQQMQIQTVEGGGQFGAWGVHLDRDVRRVAWSRFVPNAMFQIGLALDVAIGEMNRAQWLDRLFFPNLPERNAWLLMRNREAQRHRAN
jgi:hypothetical protein